MCDERYSTNVNYDKKATEDPAHLATVIAHEIGHLMGMYHDNDDINTNRDGKCDCPCEFLRPYL